MASWPEWWFWEIELSPHLLKRMADRRFNEVDLRSMLEDATGYHPDVVEGRWIIATRRGSTHWEVIVEPDAAQHILGIITAYPIS